MGINKKDYKQCGFIIIVLELIDLDKKFCISVDIQKTGYRINVFLLQRSGEEFIVLRIFEYMKGFRMFCYLI